MAVSPSSCLHSRIDASQRALISSVGLGLHSPDCFGIGKPNINVQFHDRVYKNINSRTINSKPKRGRLAVMSMGTPRVRVKTENNTYQYIDLWNALYRERIVFIGEYIDDAFSNKLLCTLLYLDSINNDKLYMYINCSGGDLTPSLAIYDTMQSLTSPVGTHCLGYAPTMPGFILAAGVKGNRSVMPVTIIELEAPAGAARGQAADVLNEAGELTRIKDYLFKELSQQTGHSVEKINKDLQSTRRFNAHEALEYGLIDRIVWNERKRS